MARLLGDQADGMADGGVVRAAYADGRMVAFSLSYRHAGTVWLRATGYDYDYARLRGAHEYFNLVYYLPIEDAYAHGATTALGDRRGTSGHRNRLRRRS
jgi:hypothetical protein